MKQWRFEVSNRAGFPDVHGDGVVEGIKEFGINTVEALQSARVYLIEADFDADFAELAAQQLLADTVCQEYYIGRSTAPAGPMTATISPFFTSHLSP